MYRGSLRLLLVLLHDFPEFLTEYYFSLCDVIPARCIQMRNIVLSAFPSDTILPDPYLRDAKFEAISEMGPIPPILSDFTSGLKIGDLRGHLDQYLLGRGSLALVQPLKDRLKLSATTADFALESYNASLINALVIYIGVSSVAQGKARSGSVLFNPADSGAILLRQLVVELEPEGMLLLFLSFVDDVYLPMLQDNTCY
jgi:CCR4-NOT transcription complex subunit 1